MLSHNQRVLRIDMSICDPGLELWPKNPFKSHVRIDKISARNLRKALCVLQNAKRKQWRVRISLFGARIFETFKTWLICLLAKMISQMETGLPKVMFARFWRANNSLTMFVTPQCLDDIPRFPLETGLHLRANPKVDYLHHLRIWSGELGISAVVSWGYFFVNILERWSPISIRTLFQNKDFTGDGSGFRIAKI